MDINLHLFFILASTVLLDVVSCYNVEISQNGPIVQGGIITFNAILYDEGQLATGSFKYEWKDNALPPHINKFDSKSNNISWILQFTKDYPPGDYEMQLTVFKYFIFPYEITSSRMKFTISDTLNGKIDLIQNNQTRKNDFISNSETVNHHIVLKDTDQKSLNNATEILTYWFVDCVYYGFRNTMNFSMNYTEIDKEHTVEAIIVGDFTPLPPPTTTSTTMKATTKTTTKAPKTTTSKPATRAMITTEPTTGNPITKKIVKRQSNDMSFPFACNGTRISGDPSKTYGFFRRTFTVKAPISKVNITGNNWLQHGDLLTLNVKCQGSENMYYCVKYRKGVFNVTNNETCETKYKLDGCEFMVQRYFSDATEYTVIVIIENDVSKVTKSAVVTVYKVKKQAQLSVIVVPVVFSLAAVWLIVFGVAYYLQNRSRFVIEVADFDFGPNFSDMEYKTFRERLRESISNAFFTRAPSPSPSTSEVPVWPPGHKYGSMTT